MLVALSAVRAHATDCDVGNDPADCLCAHFRVTEVAFGVIIPVGEDYRLKVTEVVSRTDVVEHAYVVGDEIMLASVPGHDADDEFWVYTQYSTRGGYLALGRVTQDGGIRDQSLDANDRCQAEMDARELAEIWTSENWADCNSVVRERLNLPRPNDCSGDRGGACAGRNTSDLAPGIATVLGYLAVMYHRLRKGRRWLPGRDARPRG